MKRNICIKNSVSTGIYLVFARTPSVRCFHARHLHLNVNRVFLSPSGDNVSYPIGFITLDTLSWPGRTALCLPAPYETGTIRDPPECKGADSPGLPLLGFNWTPPACVPAPGPSAGAHVPARLRRGAGFRFASVIGGLFQSGFSHPPGEGLFCANAPTGRDSAIMKRPLLAGKMGFRMVETSLTQPHVNPGFSGAKPMPESLRSCKPGKESRRI